MINIFYVCTTNFKLKESSVLDGDWNNFVSSTNGTPPPISDFFYGICQIFVVTEMNVGFLTTYTNT